MSWLGVALVLLAFLFLAVDLKVAGHGLPTVGGAAMLTLGILVLFDATPVYLQASLVILAAVAVLTAVLFVVVSRELLEARGRPVTTGAEGMVGEVGVVKEPIGTSSPGWVFVRGELWQATIAVAPEDAHKRDREQMVGIGRKVQVVDVRNGRVVVLPVEAAVSGQLPEV
jgi:membrane-bound serine protease (ClpP class)